MGNTLRKTFGNMCGAEASKELSSENHLKPISKPKNGKKERKEKKNKKEKNNGALQKISEEDEASQSVTQPAEKSIQAEVVGQLKIEKSNAVDIKQTEVSEKFYDKRDKQKTATIQHPAEKMTTEATSVKTYIIQSIPEKSSFENPNLSQSPVSVMTHSVIMPAGPDHVKEVLIEDEEHNMLDFGKYCFIDPSTGDIQVLRNRSRSLNSLVSLNALSQSSRSSSRSNLSRFGSFEFVTGGEVLIAEKNQLATSLH